MDVEVIDVREVTVAHPGGVSDGVENELNKHGEATVSGTFTARSENGIPEPRVGMEFDSVLAAKNFYDDYAKRMGFSTRIGDFSCSSGDLGVREFSCAKDGGKGRANSNCRAMVRVECKANGKWAVTKFVKEHNHSSTGRNKLHYLKPRRHFAGSTKPVSETYQGVVPSGVMYVSVEGGSVPPGTNIGVKISHPVDTTENNSRSRTAYSYFGDAVIFDAMYRVNQYAVPFAPFTGVNHHGQTILFACALLLDESDTSFVWLFKTFLACMHDQAPVSITTDQDKSIEAAIPKVLPKTRHYINKWHVLQEGQQKMAPTIEEFESSWNSILKKYDLLRNEWLQSIYNTRRQWVPAYFRDSFFAAISPEQEFPSWFFNGYVDQQATLPLFFMQYERALENSFEKEIEADFDTISNRIDDDGYTSTFSVVKFEDDQTAYIVSFNVLEMKANCSCQMFEYSGIVCRHVLTVFTVTNILTLPSHYILKRWTKNAKSGSGSLEGPGELHGSESLITQYNHLCREAIICAEEGAISPETYNVALNALREVGKKLAAANKSVARAPATCVHNNVIRYDNQMSPSPATNVTPLLWPQQDEMAQCFNLNDISTPAQLFSDLNLPRTPLVCLHRHDDHSDNMRILPCLKSMTWSMEHKTLTPANRVALITLKLRNLYVSASLSNKVGISAFDFLSKICLVCANDKEFLLLHQKMMRMMRSSTDDKETNMVNVKELFYKIHSF
ncbi:hypothetical protein LIER_20500 [Lithospermum erythrorhizon]|uniref:Protein FAR1-RELATED SEQUENCE n=1 Tax=Lithospermum erythrorhizon TaxID=34254 RepID=A0AAV3QPT5_LITER